MEKDFDMWNVRKKRIDQGERTILFREGEIWWCAVGINIGSEQNGVNELFERPVLVLKKFSKDVLWILPITNSIKSNLYYSPIGDLEFSSSVILSQIRLISSKRLLRRVRAIDKSEFFLLIEKVKNLLPQSN